MSVQAAVQEFVDSLGEMSARQKMLASDALRVAALLDKEDFGAAAAALSRELRQIVSQLEPAMTRAAAAPAPNVDPVAAIKDEIAAKRQQRRQAQ